MKNAMHSFSERVLKLRQQESLRPVLLLAGIAFIFNLGFSLSGFYNWTYDSWAHMFFASHYMNTWFNTWDIRWFDGMTVTSYPPLVTQLLALIGFVVGLTKAYMLLSFTAMVAMPVAMYFFCKCFLSRQQATWAGLFSIFLPSVYLANYDYGQLPAIFALLSSLFMGTFLWHYLNNGKWQAGLAAVLLLGITAASHHFTFICFIPALVTAVSLTFLLSCKPDIKTYLRRLGIFVLISIPLAIIPILPFWQFYLHMTPQTSIPNLSRVNLLTNHSALLQFFIAPYLFFLLAVPIAIVAAIKHKYLVPLLVIFTFLFVLGLGATTPIPRLLFGQLWQWLTYDRFSLWAGVLLIPLMVKIIPSDLLEFGKRRIQPVIIVFLTLILVVMSLGAAYFGSEPSRKSFLPSPAIVDVEFLTEFLTINAGEQYRYITLGFGEAQSEKLSTITKSSSLDGGYYTARSLPILTKSGIGMIDSSKYLDPQLTTLGTILADAGSYNLKWVLVNDIYFFDILKKNGFVLALSSETENDNRFGSVTIWSKNDIPAITEEAKSEVGPYSYLWGIAPLLLVFALGWLGLLQLKSLSRS
jgi:hypothetical protein